MLAAVMVESPAKVPRPVTEVEAMVMAVLAAAVSLPWASTVKVGTVEALP